MGRTSKFSFPIPGRKHSSSKETATESSRTSTLKLSKAQRVLGTENALNIDSPTQAEYVHGYPNPTSSRMSISISESTNESGSIRGSQSEQWDRESGVFPQGQRFGQRYGDDGTTSISTGRLRREDSSSTLRSHYDRQKSPLSISQQTSESSARDLALRKGFPPVAQRSPLLQVDLMEPFDNQVSKSSNRAEESRYQEDISRDRGSRKKPARLDLSMLFPRARRRGSKSSDADSLATSTKSVSTNASRLSRTSGDPGRRKLTKKPSKESLQSKQSIRSTQSYDPKQRTSSLTSGTGGTLYQLYDHYEHMPVPSPRMDRIPEIPKVPERIAPRKQDGGNYSKPESYSRQQKDWGSVRSPTEKEPFSWKNIRSGIARHEGSSVASVSSLNTKTSRHTSGSGISSSDLRLNSVLSLSSDSEADGSDREAIKSPTMSSRSKASRGSSHKTSDGQRHARQPSGGLTPRSHSSKNGSRKAGQESQFQSIPETSTDVQSSRRVAREEPSRSSNQQKESRQSSQKEKRSSRKPSVTPAKSLQPTPPLSPTSVELREGSKSSSRLMAVTKQEEALLEALRQKR
jgi:hypothetical protein